MSAHTCGRPDCAAPHYAKGLCRLHYKSEWQRADRRKRGIPAKAPAIPKPPRPARAPRPEPDLPAGWEKPAREPKSGGSSQPLDVGPVPPTDPDQAQAAALVMAGVAVRLDAADDLGCVLDALGLRVSS